jgi:hypothetical protein
MRYLLIGIKNEVYQEKIGEAFLDHYDEELIATFDTREEAEQYIELSRLKTPSQSFLSAKVFRDRSLLSNCEDARIDSLEPDVVPHNPEI